MSEVISVIVIGAGSRGTGYSRIIKEMPDKAKVVAVAEPRDFYRNRIGDMFDIPEELRFRSWDEVTARPRFANAVMICTQDAMHEAPAIACAKLGYNILLEKPVAPTADACRRIIAEVKKAGVTFAVCHVLRYTKFTQMLKKLLLSGAVGDIVSIQHLEPVKHWHQAHSFVRGNWRNSVESSCMLLQKCCHDLDWLRYIMDVPCRKVQSFGSLKFFNRAHQPAGAADRCLDCPEAIERKCPYSAKRIYLDDRALKGNFDWPTCVLTPEPTVEAVTKALKEGPYGRCVFACDNDVVDNQVVNLSFDGDRTASMTMTAFCDETGRQTRIFGTMGSIVTDSKIIKKIDYLTGETTEIDTEVVDDGGIGTGHGGGDGGLVKAFIDALYSGDKTSILSGADESLESHLMVFAAEESRLAGEVKTIRH